MGGYSVLTQHSFATRFRASRAAEIKVATYLLCRGFTVTLPTRKLAKDISQRKEFADNGDIYANNKRIEVKHLKNNFQWQEWTYSNVTICAKQSFDNASPRPDYYYLVNQSMTIAALIDVETTRPDWKVMQINDTARNYVYDVYSVEPEYLAWRYLEEEEKL